MPTAATGGPAGHGALSATARIVSDVIAESARVAAAATALSEQVSGQADRLVLALGGGPPDDLAEAVRCSAAAGERIEQAAAALHDSTQALSTFLRQRI
jgi:hypothetical protein